MIWECLGNVLKMSLKCPGKLVNWRHMTQNCPDFTTFVLIKLSLQNRDDLKTNLKTNFGTKIRELATVSPDIPELTTISRQMSPNCLETCVSKAEWTTHMIQKILHNTKLSTQSTIIKNIVPKERNIHHGLSMTRILRTTNNKGSYQTGRPSYLATFQRIKRN